MYKIFSSNNIFVTSSNLANNHFRLNDRCQLLFKGVNFKGKRVLDLGCHNGRWMYAALKFGVSKVLGVDRCGTMLQKAKNNFKYYKAMQKK